MPCSLGHPGPSPTSFSEFYTAALVSLPVPASTIAVCLICCMPSCIGLMFDDQCSTNSALLSQTLPVANICDQPAATSCSCHDTDVQCSAVSPSLLLVCRPGTRCQTVYVTRHVLSTASGVNSKLLFSEASSIYSALEAMHYTNL